MKRRKLRSTSGTDALQSFVPNKSGDARKITRRLPIETKRSLTSDLMLAGLCAAHHQPATKEFFVMQFLDGAFCFLDGLHLHESKSLRALVVPVTYHLCILHVPDAVKQFEEIALSSVKGQIADVKTRRSDFDRFRFSWRPRRLRTIARCHCCLRCGPAVSKKCGDPLPECLFLSFHFSLPIARAAIAPASGSPARTARASPG